LTRDHTYVTSLVDAGRVTAEEARNRDDRALLNRALASGTPSSPDISVQNTYSGDRLVLTTDGVHGTLPVAGLADLLVGNEPVDEVAANVENAVVNAGAPDNYAVIVIDIA